MTTNDPGVYVVDPDASTTVFRTRAIFGLLGVRGTFDVDDGTVTVADPAEDSTVDVRVSACSFASGNRQRDGHVRSPDYLDTERYPRVLFSGRRFEPSDVGGILHGQLTVKETTRPVDLHVERIAVAGGELTARATTTVDRFDFGIRTAPGMTGRRVHLTVDVLARKR